MWLLRCFNTLLEHTQENVLDGLCEVATMCQKQPKNTLYNHPIAPTHMCHVPHMIQSVLKTSINKIK